MTGPMAERLRGRHAAIIVPLTGGLRQDEHAPAPHITAVAGTPGIRGLLANDHAGESLVLRAAEERAPATAPVAATERRAQDQSLPRARLLDAEVQG